jgi:hypothetical protein
MNGMPDLRPAWSRTWCVCWKSGSGFGLFTLGDVEKLNATLVARGEVGYQVVALCPDLAAAQEKGREWKRRKKEQAATGTNNPGPAGLAKAEARPSLTAGIRGDELSEGIASDKRALVEGEG